MNKKIIITGATGLIGRRICKALIDRGDAVTIFSGNANKASDIIKGAHDYIMWDFNNLSGWQKNIEGKDAIIHLAGASIAGKRWNVNYKKIILDSRVVSTKNLVQAISKIKDKPSVFISASATGYYGNGGEQVLTEKSNRGNDFLSEVCKAWEDEASKVEELNIRSASIRTGIVLSTEGGALKQMLLPFKLFIGGPLGSGNQWFPWIHIDDLINIYLYVLDNPEIKGAVNAASPYPVTMNKFAETIGRTLHRPSLFKVPFFGLRIAVGEVANALVASQRVVPNKLSGVGFKFRFDNIESALNDLIA